MRQCHPWALLSALVLAIAALLTTAKTQEPSTGISSRCVFHEAVVSQPFIVSFQSYGQIGALETRASAALSAITTLSLRMQRRTAQARRIPSDFVVVELYSCEAKSAAVCHAVEHDLVSQPVGEPLGIKRVYRDTLVDMISLLSIEEDASARRLSLFRSRKKPAGLIDALDVRSLWDMGYKGQGVKIGVLDTGLSSGNVRNVKERVNWTHEKKNQDTVGHGTFVAGIIGGTDGRCPGIAPEAELYVFRMFTTEQLSFTSWFLDAFNYALHKGINVLNLSTGGPDFRDLPFVEKIRELTANGVVVVSAVGNSGPKYGTLTNPADQIEVIGVGGVGTTNNVADFSSRGMTTWELPFGVGRIKPDIITHSQDISGAHISRGCKVLSGTSVSAPIVSAAIALLASSIPEQHRWDLFNPATVKRVLMESADRLPAYYDEQGLTARNHIFEQGSGKLNVTRSLEMVQELVTKLEDGDNLQQAQQLAAFPSSINMTDCPYMWPLCSQSLYPTSQPLIVNLTVSNPSMVSSAVLGPPKFRPLENGDQLTVSVVAPPVIWPYFCSVGVFIQVADNTSTFVGKASGELVLTIENIDSRPVELIVPIEVLIGERPPKHRRILWDQFHNIPYPSAFVPRDNLLSQRELLDSAGDHLHTNFHQLWNILIGAGYSVEVLPFEYSCIDLARYGTVLLVDPEEEFFVREIEDMHQALKYANTSLLVFADWFDSIVLDSMDLFDTSTLSAWQPVTGGANIPALNALLQEFNIQLGDGSISNDSIQFSSKWKPFPYWSGTHLVQFPVDGYVGSIDASNDTTWLLNRTESILRDMPVLGLYQVPSRHGGRIAVFGDSSCLDASVHHSTTFAHCFDLLLALLNFTNHAEVPPSLLKDDASPAIRLLTTEFVASDRDIPEPRHDPLWKHSKPPHTATQATAASTTQFHACSLCVGHATRGATMSVQASPVELYVVLSNKNGKKNLGTYLRTASAFGAKQVIVVGSDRFGTHGAHGAHKYVDIVHVYDFQQAKDYLGERSCEIVGIKRDGIPLFAAQQANYQRSCAFVVDNEPQMPQFPGLSPEQVAICDRFVHVPHHTANTAQPALETTVETAIVFYHFTLWAKFPVRSFQEATSQGKFDLDAYPTYDAASSAMHAIGARKTAEREAKRACAKAEAEEQEQNSGYGQLFA
ncbi:TPA: hypothetical protein N0F65_008136 [Lagenidium giganteum]|uniref:subtilisin n=1 Tax=Lagenidium giganteum TaxID=4803 RepID=A0AAV2YIK5_9STRA|nr:TPA: hypothetical protein N0F65_008136 [Lagenidium giganteum]